jgi:pimeloyl-ACP methyl ester carboxylesterase
MRGLVPWAAGAALLVAAQAAAAQSTVPRILIQDSTLNNLVDPPGYETGTLGELARVKREGSGRSTMILVPGIGFGGEIYDSLASAFASDFTTYAVTVPGFGDTPAPPVPPEGTSFGEQTWTRGALAGLEALVDSEGLDDVVVVGHWLTGTQLAVALARSRPEAVRGVVLLAGAARFVAPPGQGPAELSLQDRINGVDHYMAPQWFKTVTRETWDDNNFLPSDYATHPVIGLRLWRQAARPRLHTWIRYLNEFYAQDVVPDVVALDTPVLLIHPDFEGAYQPEGNRYLDRYTFGSWNGVEASERVTQITIPGTRVVLWADQRDQVVEEIRTWLRGSDEP